MDPQNDQTPTQASTWKPMDPSCRLSVRREVKAAFKAEFATNLAYCKDIRVSVNPGHIVIITPRMLTLTDLSLPTSFQGYTLSVRYDRDGRDVDPSEDMIFTSELKHIEESPMPVHLREAREEVQEKVDLLLLEGTGGFMGGAYVGVYEWKGEPVVAVAWMNWETEGRVKEELDGKRTGGGVLVRVVRSQVVPVPYQ
ncbi:hypothetical protein BJ508DRAFT_103595 [Ascobolus immersus RN42]|uniref:Uncharacterized protein n=1 Tax=Ascobolus immersus RN42 TaxID=1160509 RepID=A0A3N4HDY4_ASCIM|nr:hypothetical protein BJ508DRAFT_103595 [Ascobolus immersus RN42]